MTVTLTELGAALGITKMSVSRGKHRLPKTLVRNGKGRVVGVSSLPDAIAEWNENGDYTDAPQRAPQMLKEVSPASSSAIDDEENDETVEGSMASAAVRDKHWRAKLAELKFKEAAKELVPAAEVRREWADLLSHVRTKLLGIPTRVRQAIPTLTVADVLVVENLVRESLEDLVAEEEASS